MKKFTSIVCLFLFLIAINIQMVKAQALKIGVFDIQRIMRESKTIEGYRQEFLKNIETKKRLLKDKEDSVKSIENKFRKEMDTLSVSEKKAMEERLERELKELKRLREDIDSELIKMDRELTQKAFANIGSVIKSIAEKEGYSIIFERNQAGIVHLKDSIDITKKILKELN
ncbi:MAG TPA: OmpH family outer membrane protein [Syntrophorhabdaceae bacterium]|nr:OmpH family outer membrane protein [Syntrophorhabdaceae bacterium]